MVMIGSLDGLIGAYTESSGGGFSGTILNSNVQPITNSILSGTTSDVTISAVTLANSYIHYQGLRSNRGGWSALDTTLAAYELTSTTNARLSRQTSSTTDTIGEATVLEFHSDFVESVQSGTITLTSGEASDTATITAVDTDYAVVFYQSGTTSDTGTDTSLSFCGLTLTDSTTVTAERVTSAATDTITVNYTVVEYKPEAISSIQQFKHTDTSTDLTHTKTITSVDLDRSMLAYGGSTSALTIQSFLGAQRADLQDSTTVRFRRGGSNVVERNEYYTVVEFAEGVIDNIQRGSITLSLAQTSNTATITSVDTNKSFINFSVYESDSNSDADPEASWTTLELTDATTVTAQRDTAQGQIIINYEVVTYN